MELTVFDWLTQEIAAIRSNKFHLVEGPASPEFREVVERHGQMMSTSYKCFVLQFGNAKLYRRTTSYNDSYLIEVYAGPRETSVEGGMQFLQIGKTSGSLVFVKEAPLDKCGESPVFEWQHGQGMRQRSAGFLGWLEMKCNWARKQYKKREWKKVIQGPLPFSDFELDVVKARRCIIWRVVGISADGNLRFEIRNSSKIALPYLTLGFRGKMRPPKQGELKGLLRLPISTVLPECTGVVDFDCYKDFVSPEDGVPFDLPDPGTEDRLVYWEFNSSGRLPDL